ERDRGVVHYAKIFVDQVKIVETTEPLGLRVILRIGVIDTVHLRRLQYHLRLDLDCAQGGRRVGAEVGIAAAGREDNYPALLQVSYACFTRSMSSAMSCTMSGSMPKAALPARPSPPSLSSTRL